MPINPNSPYNNGCEFPAIPHTMPSVKALTSAEESIKLQAFTTNLEKRVTQALSKSTYQIWLDNGHEGTEKDFLEWLVGPPTVIVIDGKEYKYVWDTRKVDLSAAFAPYTVNLTQEVDRSKAEDIRLAELIRSTARALQNDCNILYDSLDAETSNRLAGDKAIQTALNAEIVRAESRELDIEQTLNQAVTELTALVNTKCALEAAVRGAGLAQLTTELDTVKTTLDKKIDTEIAKCIDADIQLQGDLTLESVSRKEAIDTLQTNLDNEANTARLNEADLDKKISTEAEERANSDLSINIALNTEKSERQATDRVLTDTLETETAARISADTVLQSNLNIEIERAKNKETELDNSLEKAVTDLNTTFETVDSELTAAINTESSTRQEAISKLQADLSLEAETARAAEEKLNQDLSKESVERSNADVALNASLTEEKTARQAADTANAQAISDESAARLSADKTILDTIGKNFNTTNTVSSVIATEQQERIAADSELDDRLLEVEETLDVFFKDAAQDGEGLENALDTLKEIQAFIDTDTTTANKIVEAITQNTDAITAQAEFDAQTYETKGEATNKLTEAKTYTDEALETAKLYSDEGDVFHTDILTVNGLGGIKANADLDGMTVREILTILLYPYVAFVINNTSRIASAATLENGATQSLSSVSISITKKSKPITSVKLFNGSTLLGEKTGNDVANGGTITFSDLGITVSKNNNPNLKFTVTDGETATDRSVGTSTFVYPYYWGKCAKAATIDETLIKGLTKKIISRGNQTDIAFTCAEERMVFAYPKVHGTLKSIIDPNNFEIINDFTRSEISITGLDGTAQTYYVYVSGASTVSDFKVDFKY